MHYCKSLNTRNRRPPRKKGKVGLPLLFGGVLSFVLYFPVLHAFVLGPFVVVVVVVSSTNTVS